MTAAGPVERRDYGVSSPWSVAVTIPARNEAERLGACLDAAALSLGDRGGIVVCVNGSDDDTVDRAQAWFQASGISGIVLDEPAPPPSGGVGRARRLSIDACMDRLRADGVILTTDADSRVAPDWVEANIAELAHAELICGTVLPDPVESAQLPAVIGQRGAIEGVYMDLTVAAYRLLDPVPFDPAPSHLNAAGASLAFRRTLYEDIGGIPERPMGEDRAFAARAAEFDWRVRHSAKAQVYTTCRLDGRTTGGMAGALRARISEDDPLADELFEPAEQTIVRLRLKAGLRHRFAGKRGFGRAWHDLQVQHPQLQRVRMRLSDLHREAPLLRAALDAAAPIFRRRTT